MLKFILKAIGPAASQIGEVGVKRPDGSSRFDFIRRCCLYLAGGTRPFLRIEPLSTTGRELPSVVFRGRSPTDNSAPARMHRISVTDVSIEIDGHLIIAEELRIEIQNQELPIRVDICGIYTNMLNVEIDGLEEDK